MAAAVVMLYASSMAQSARIASSEERQLWLTPAHAMSTRKFRTSVSMKTVTLALQKGGSRKSMVVRLRSALARLEVTGAATRLRSRKAALVDLDPLCASTLSPSLYCAHRTIRRVRRAPPMCPFP
jgi:hypothetical protein